MTDDELKAIRRRAELGSSDPMDARALCDAIDKLRIALREALAENARLRNDAEKEAA